MCQQVRNQALSELDMTLGFKHMYRLYILLFPYYIYTCRNYNLLLVKVIFFSRVINVYLT